MVEDMVEERTPNSNPDMGMSAAWACKGRAMVENVHPQNDVSLWSNCN